MKTTTHQRGARWTRRRRQLVALFVSSVVFGSLIIASPAQATPPPTPVPASATVAAPETTVGPEGVAADAILKAMAVTCTPTSSAAAAHAKYPCRWKTLKFGTNRHTPNYRAEQHTIWQMTAKGRESIVSSLTLFEHKVGQVWFKSKMASHADARLYDCVHRMKNGKWILDKYGKKAEFCTLGFHTGGVKLQDNATSVYVEYSGTTYKSSHLITSWILLVLKQTHMVDGERVPYTIRVRGRDNNKQIRISKAELED